MKEHPILFSTPMVQAILQGRKTQTRRIVKPKTPEDFALMVNMNAGIKVDQQINELISCSCPYGKAGDVLWVRETFAVSGHTTKSYIYKADEGLTMPFFNHDQKWKPSVFMPRAACRITLEITKIRVERLNTISKADCIAECIEPEPTGDDVYKNYLPDGYRYIKAKGSYRSLWESINGKDSWEANRWVWVIEFKQIN